VTGQPVELLWVKGSGGNLGTLTEPGLAVLRLDRLRALADVYPGVEREDEMVAAFDFFLARAGHPRLAALGTSFPDHYLRTKVRPMVLDVPPAAPLDEQLARLRERHVAYREDYQKYYESYATGLHIPVDSGVPAAFLR
jgi:rhamnose utilization protein RhaD (predicted bifunctional aldolase and dehydrogenase)